MNQNTIGSGPIEAKHRAVMNAVAQALEDTFNPHGRKEIAFVLMLFPFGETPGRCNYISNAQREDIITLLTEQLAYFKGMPEHDVRPV